MRRTTILLCLSSLSCVLSTDLVAVYKHDVLLLRDVDKTPSSDPPMSWESHVLSVPQHFSYPIGMTYDPKGHRLFVAEAAQKDSKIFSLNLDSNYTVKHMQSVVKTTNTTVMEDLTYDPRTGHLYWTDSYNHGVYKTWLPSGNEQKENPEPHPEPAHMFGGVIEPRGIAIDYCNELIYWSERDGSGNVPSTIEVCDLDGPSHTIIEQHDEKEVKIFYQGLTYDILGGKLLWAETIGDDFEKSYCRIVSYEYGQSLPEREVLVSLENCYPFSLTSDENYIYWADWGQQGIMRASRKDPNNVVKLVHTPQIDTKYGEHHGVYGLAILDDLTDDYIKEACKGKSNPKTQVAEEDKDAVEEELKDTVVEQKDAVEELKDTVVEQKDAVEELKDTVVEQKDAPVSSEPLEPSSHTVEEELLTREIVNKKQSPAEKELPPLASEGSESGSSENNQNDSEGKSEQSSEEPVHVSSDPAQALMMKTHICRENILLIVVVVLAVFLFIFILSTLALVFKIWYQRIPRTCKGELPTTISDKAVEVVQPRQPKRFRPKMKQTISGTSSCSGSGGSDGVSINIEDCCQMTLCDTPCYTTVKKEGRGYRSSRMNNNEKKSDDKRGLLDDLDDLSNF